MKAIVSVILGGYDTLKPAPRFEGWDAIMFTDNDYKDSKGWTIVKVNTTDIKKDSRYYKWMTHLTLPMYDMVCYIDGSMNMFRRPPEMEMFFMHPTRDKVKDEAKQIIRYYPKLLDSINRQLLFYRDEGFKDNYHLYMNGFFVRNHEPQVNKVCETIMNIVDRFCYRDQLAMPYALYKTNYKPKNILHPMNAWSYVRLNKHI